MVLTQEGLPGRSREAGARDKTIRNMNERLWDAAKDAALRRGVNLNYWLAEAIQAKLIEEAQR